MLNDQNKLYSELRPELRRAIVCCAQRTSKLHAEQLEAMTGILQRSLDDAVCKEHPCVKWKMDAPQTPPLQQQQQQQQEHEDDPGCDGTFRAIVRTFACASARAKRASRLPNSAHALTHHEPRCFVRLPGAVDTEAPRRPVCCQAPLRLPGSKVVLCHTPLGSVKLHVHTYHCSACDNTLVAQAAHIGCFPMVMSPPALCGSLYYLAGASWRIGELPAVS